MASHESSKKVRAFVVANVAAHPKDLVAVVATHFGISRQAANRHVRALVEEKIIEATGHTNARTYSLSASATKFKKWYVIAQGLEEHVAFSHTVPDDDWLIEDKSAVSGTLVTMTLSVDSSRLQREVFDRFSSEESDYAFSKTHVPVRLMQYGSDNLVSRSQAKRLLSRFERFQDVLLDFSGIESIGQGFADEVFRVFKR